jgi:hypothetical protein
MEPQSDHSNSNQPTAATAASDEQIHALIAEKEQLAADLAQALNVKSRGRGGKFKN